MCHWRRYVGLRLRHARERLTPLRHSVRNNYKRCGHYIDLPDEMIQCEDRFCKFSTTHPRNCVPPRCTETCWQYRQFPEQYHPVIDNYCAVCIQMGRSV
ncbi:hypothetical protein C2E23DRAFT_85038 [Lenzites betulinus]|nr:hypothetical protein C2E23DRAFT_85038 [Lenzites betulinus]